MRIHGRPLRCRCRLWCEGRVRVRRGVVSPVTRVWARAVRVGAAQILERGTKLIRKHSKQLYKNLT